jgi:hypothetical protein
MDSSSIPSSAKVTTAGCSSALKQIKRGPAFKNAEDVIVASAFIAASKNAICGAHGVQAPNV